MEKTFINVEELEYPENTLPVLYDPSTKEFLLFPDSLDILMEDLDYELDFISTDCNKNKCDESCINFIIGYVDRQYDSYLVFYTKVYKYTILDSTILLLRIEKCIEIYEDWEEDATSYFKQLINAHPRKIDLLYLLGLEYEDVYSNNSHITERQSTLSSLYHYFPKPISKPSLPY